MAEKLRQLLLGLKDYYSQPLLTSYKKFRDGLIYFFVGLITVYMANAHMQASAAQEVVILGGLILGGIGFFMAMLAQVRMIITRVVTFFSKDRPK